MVPKVRDMLIAYVDDNTTCAGVAVQRIGGDELNILVLGWFPTTITDDVTDVFGRSEKRLFPSYKALPTTYCLKYDFEAEIDLCINRGAEWWTSVRPPCRRNLIQQHFWPRRSKALEYLAAANYFLEGGTLEKYEALAYADEHDLLHLWVVLHNHFPELVTRPPDSLKSTRSNAVFKVNWKRLSVSISFE